MASSAIGIKPNNYDGYYARAKALMEANDFTGALADTQQALEKVKTQQKHQKISPEVKETLSRLSVELSQLTSDRYQTETTDL